MSFTDIASFGETDNRNDTVLDKNKSTTNDSDSNNLLSNNLRYEEDFFESNEDQFLLTQYEASTIIKFRY